MLKLATVAFVSLIFAVPALAQQQKSQQGKSTGRMTYEGCLAQKQKAGLPAARAAQVCQQIIKGQ